MLIPIMIDSFARAVEFKEENRKKAMLALMGQNVHLTLYGGDIERFEEYIVAKDKDNIEDDQG